MIGLDTNVLIRLLADDDPVQARLALRRLSRPPGEPLVVNVMVLVEVVWMLRARHRYDRGEIALALASILALERVVVPDRPLVAAALTAYRAGGADFADHVIQALNAAAGATTTLTFDQAAAREPGFSLIAAGDA